MSTHQLQKKKKKNCFLELDYSSPGLMQVCNNYYHIIINSSSLLGDCVQQQVIQRLVDDKKQKANDGVLVDYDKFKREKLKNLV